MTRLKSIIEEIQDNSNEITARTIFNFYFLWWIFVNQPSLFGTSYGRDTLNYYLQQYKLKYVNLFKKLLVKQIAKYIQLNRVDPDFPKIVINKLATLSAANLQTLMAKTFRTDLKRRNETWNLAADFLTRLENASSIEDMFLYINQLNNVVHNSQMKILSKTPHYSELSKAFDTVHKATSPMLQLKPLVDKDIQDLLDQDIDEKSGQEKIFPERIMMREGLEKILRLEKELTCYR